MSFDPNREDYQRLGLRFARSLDGGDPSGAAKAFASFGRRFSQDRDSLPQTDADRAFHLVARATMVIDYKLPFAESDARAAELIQRGHTLLDEALALDPNCHDATRMQHAATIAGFDAFFHYLEQGEKDVRRSCTAARDAAATSMVANSLARPDFVAYKFADRTTPAFRLVQALGAKPVFWIIRNPQDLAAAETEGGVAIFEGFVPDSTHAQV